MLADCGADIEARDYRGRTPLLLAADLDRFKILVRYYLQLTSTGSKYLSIITCS